MAPRRPIPGALRRGVLGQDMSNAAPAAADPAAKPPPATKSGKRKLILLAIPLLLVGLVAGLWFGGILPPLLGMGHGEHAETKDGDHKNAEGKNAEGKNTEGKNTEGKNTEGKTGSAKNPDVAAGPTFVDVPELIANLNVGGRRASYVKLHSRLELAKPSDEATVKAAMPRLLDMFQTYLREMRPEELRGSAGTYRLREQLIARANVAVQPAHVTDVLFTELLIQ
jgi:flagellar FliL protein